MKQFLYSLTICFLATSAIAQQNFIELSVSETVQLKATSFTYEVKAGSFSPYDMLEELDMYNEEVSDPDDIIAAPELTLDEVANILRREKFDFSNSAEQSYTVSSNKKDGSLLVTLAGLKELNRLRKLLTTLDGVSGKLSGTTYEDVSSYYAEVYPRLIVVAKERASLLAKTSSKKVGSVIQVSEGRLSNVSSGDTWSDYMTSIMEMASMMEGKKFVATKSEVIALTYRFEIID